MLESAIDSKSRWKHLDYVVTRKGWSIINLEAITTEI